VIRRVALGAALGMPLVVLGLMLTRSVDVPFLDEWTWSSLSIALHRGTLTWAGVFTQHNEHRNVVANLIFVAIDRTLGWNVLAEELVSFALLCGAQSAAWFLVRATTLPRRRLPLFAVISVLLWSLAQWENFAFGYNIGWNVCTAAACTVLALLAREATPVRVVCAALAATIATFASAQGAILFPIGFVLTAVTARQRVVPLGVWSVFAALTAMAFFAGYTAAAAPARMSPAAFTIYMLTVLGTPIGAWWGLACCVATGALTLAGFGWLIVRGPAERRVRIVWSCAAAYALAGALAITGGRLGFGFNSALSSRYAAIAMFLGVAVAGLIAAAWEPIVRAPRALVVVCAIVIGYGVLDANLHGNRAWQLYAIARHQEVCALVHHDDAALRTLANADTATVEREAAGIAAVGDVPYRTAARACPPATPAP